MIDALKSSQQQNLSDRTQVCSDRDCCLGLLPVLATTRACDTTDRPAGVQDESPIAGRVCRYFNTL